MKRRPGNLYVAGSLPPKRPRGSGTSPVPPSRGPDGSSFIQCPLCNARVPIVCINAHIDATCPAAAAAPPRSTGEERPLWSTDESYLGTENPSGDTWRAPSLPVGGHVAPSDWPQLSPVPAAALSFHLEVEGAAGKPSNTAGPTVPPAARPPPPSSSRRKPPALSASPDVGGSSPPETDAGRPEGAQHLPSEIATPGGGERRRPPAPQPEAGPIGLFGSSPADVEQVGGLGLGSEAGELGFRAGPLLPPATARGQGELLTEEGPAAAARLPPLLPSWRPPARAAGGPAAPPGLLLVEKFVSPEEERELVRALDSEGGNHPWAASTFNGAHLGKAWGVRTDLKRRTVSRAAARPLPEWLEPLAARMRAAVPPLRDFRPNEANAIDYRRDAGHWLKPHVDDRQLSGKVIVTLSLLGACHMSFTREGSGAGAGAAFCVRLDRGCLQVLTGESRYSYKHGIENRHLGDARRVSLTFRQSVVSEAV